MVWIPKLLVFALTFFLEETTGKFSLIQPGSSSFYCVSSMLDLTRAVGLDEVRASVQGAMVPDSRNLLLAYT